MKHNHEPQQIIDRWSEGPLTYCLPEDVAKLEAINAELLEALEGMLQGFLVTQSLSDYPIDAPCNKAAAAIAKAKGEGV